MAAKGETAEEWTEEFFYFGNGSWPSDVTYRSKGDRRQVRVELGVHLVQDEGDPNSYIGSPEKIAEFLQSYEDCTILVRDSYPIAESYGGGREAPSITVLGWQELTTEAEKARYEEDKRIGGY